MKKIFISLLLLLSTIAYSQSTTITPGAVLPQMTTAQRTGLANPVNGMMVYDTNTNSYWFYQQNSWVQLANGGGSNYWQLNGANGNEIKNTNSGGFWSANPTTVANTIGVVNTVPIEGDGTRLMWIPSMSAFRVGTVVSSKAWDKDSVGAFSIGIGYNTKAKGIASIAMGESTTASGNNSTAIGFRTTASSKRSTAMGYFTNASGENSTAMGFSTTASGDNSTAMGRSTTASGESSTAMGYFTNASGENSTAMGSSTTASGDNSIAMGSSTTASGSSSAAMGVGSTASGYSSFAMGNATNSSAWYSTAMGNGTQAKAFSGTSIGRYNNNTDSPDPVNPSSTDRIFQIGNGSGSSTRSNAMTVLRNAKTGINTATPDAMLHVNGFTKLGDDAPKIKTKKIIGTTSANSTGTTGLAVALSHGIGDADKILSIDVMVENASGQWTHGWYPQPNYEFGYYLTNATVVIVNTSGNSSVIAGRPVRVLIVYEE